MTVPNYVAIIIILATIAVVAVGAFAKIIGKVDRRYW